MNIVESVNPIGSLFEGKDCIVRERDWSGLQPPPNVIIGFENQNMTSALRKFGSCSHTRDPSTHHNHIYLSLHQKIKNNNKYLHMADPLFLFSFFQLFRLYKSSGLGCSQSYQHPLSFCQFNLFLHHLSSFVSEAKIKQLIFEQKYRKLSFLIDNFMFQEVQLIKWLAEWQVLNYVRSQNTTTASALLRQFNQNISLRQSQKSQMLPEQSSNVTVDTTLVRKNGQQIFGWLLSFHLQSHQQQRLFERMIYFQKFDLIISSRNTNALILIILLMKVWLLLLALIVLSASSPCQKYIYKLVQLYYQDKAQLAKQVAVYALNSGKLVDDLGFPKTCIKDSSRAYFTGKVDAQGTQSEYTAYLGICFTSKCNTQEMNEYGGIILNTLLNITVFDNSTISFSQPSFDPQTTAGSIVFSILLSLFVLVALKEGIQKLFKGCLKQTRQQDDDTVSKYDIKFVEDYDPTLLVIQEKEGFFKRSCIFTKLGEYFEPQQTNKIVAFSSIRILAIPLAFFGYLFYLCNLGSVNYFSFYKEIYQESFSKIALAAYYLPDVLFFISGFIFARKGFTLIELENRPVKPLISLFVSKLKRLYPLYLIIILIYWQISPTFHAGPVWFEYQEEAAQCNSSWWKVFLLIDNWFENGCYNFSWFIPVEIQLTVLNIIILLLFARKKNFGLISLGISLLSSWILVLTISSPLPSSLETTLSYSAEKYFKSTYSHMPFYLLGVLNAYFAHSEKFKLTLQKLTQNNILRVILLILGFFFILLVIDRPEVWEKVLGFELGLARTGFFVGIYFLMFCSMFGGKVKKTVIHKMSSLSLGVLLIGGIIISSAFWCGQSFPYLDQQYLIEYTITNLLIAVPVGGLIAALVWPKPPKEETITL